MLHIIYIHILYLADGSAAFVFLLSLFFFLPSDGFARAWNLLKAGIQTSKKWIGM